MRKILFFISALFILIGPSYIFAIDFETVANTAPSGYVSDFAGVLQNSEEIESAITELEKNTTTEIAVVIIDELPETHTIEDFAVELFEKWGIGKKEKDNGLLFLISINDRKFRIEVGYGLEGTITDLTAMDIAEKNFPPNFKNGNYDLGILDAIRDTKGFIEKDQTIIDEYSGQNIETSTIYIGISLIIWIIIVTIFINMPNLFAAHGLGSLMSILMIGFPFLIVYVVVAFFAWLIKHSPPSSGGGFTSNKSYSSSSSWGSSSSGGGFGGFGGGMSGGGGYSGGW